MDRNLLARTIFQPNHASYLHLSHNIIVLIKSFRQLSDDFCNLRDVAVTGEDEILCRARIDASGGRRADSMELTLST